MGEEKRRKKKEMVQCYNIAKKNRKIEKRRKSETEWAKKKTGIGPVLLSFITYDIRMIRYVYSDLLQQLAAVEPFFVTICIRLL